MGEQKKQTKVVGDGAERVVEGTAEDVARSLEEKAKKDGKVVEVMSEDTVAVKEIVNG